MNKLRIGNTARAVAGFVLVAAMLAGCVEDGAPEPQGDETSEPGTTDAAPCMDCGDDPPDGAVEPSWRVGQWWEWTVTSGDGGWRFPLKTVVASEEPYGARIGSDGLEPGMWAGWFHLPPIGEVRSAELSWEAHDAFMPILQFPLRDGMRWTSTLEGTPIQLSSVRSDDGSYDVEGLYENERVALRATYDPQAEMYSSIAFYYGGSEPWSSATLTDYGEGDAEAVFVPASDDLVLRGAAAPSQPAVADSFMVADGVHHIVVGCETVGGPGVFSVVLQSPTGEQHTCPGDGPVFTQDHDVLDLVIVPAVAGQWQYELIGTADGFVFTEIMAVIVERSD